MSTSGFVGQHFVCHITMVEQIKCVHNITFKAPGLTIDKAGTVGEVLSYTFNANEGLTPQDMGIIGGTPGTFYLFADITSPYFVSASGAKIKKDKIKIRIRSADPDGWKGTDHGLLNNSTLSPSRCTEPDLYYKYTHVSGSAIISFDPNSISEQVLVVMSGAAYGVKQTNIGQGAVAFACNAIGVYIFTVYANGKYSTNPLGPALAITARKDAGPLETVTPNRRGVQLDTSYAAAGIDFNVALPTSMRTTVVDSYNPGTFSTTFTLYQPANRNPGVTYTKSGAFTIQAAGQFSSPPGYSISDTATIRLFDGAGTNFASIDYTVVR